ncbi:ribonuclease R [Dubosiella muris]|uniref:Ribonuclease R n=1 Tax=Dubosiella muris TaxID=3038133 RepID=A0AC61R609_9FIRM|nr:ribonuclease R [Dubosiella muris]TGY65375.1 ribonuclease R [Dubosiella muris]
MRQEINALLQKNEKMTLQQIEQALDLHTSAQIKELMETLQTLEDERKIYNDHTHYIWIDNDQYFIGRVKDVSKFELAIINPEGKIYVPKSNAKDAFDRDEVLVHKTKEGNRVVHIYSRGVKNITGTFYRDRDGWRFRSDVDLHTSFKVTNLKQFSLSNNVKAVVEIEKYSRPLEVKIIRLIGPANEAGVDVTALLYENEVRQEFPEPVIEQVKEVSDHVTESECQGRTDFRDLLTVTIDGDDSKDFDDAISLEKTKDGYRLYVHIADVSHYVQENSALDQEAYLRGTSVYVVDRCVPMLPFELSNGICSLNPDVDRLTLSCVMDIDNNGKVVKYDIVPSIIHSDKRCTYNNVNRVLKGDTEVQAEYADVKEMLLNFEQLTKLLQKQTKNRGSINFSTKEPKIILNKKGKPIDVQVKERGYAEQMIEEAMVLANVCVANYLNQHKFPGVFRVHEKPDPEKVETLYQIAKVFNVPADLPKDVSALEIQRFLETIDDETAQEVLSLVALRTMQKARYDADCIGHFGLALDEYCHFTSPIRRYSDLVVHRMLRRYCFDKNKDARQYEKDKLKVRTQSAHISEKEKDAVNAERTVNDYKMAQFMENKIGQKFLGTIISVMNFGFFVELDNTIEGLVPMHTLMDDYYNYDEDTMSLVGENNGKVFQIGQKINVLCTDVDAAKGQVTFGIEQNSTRKAKEIPFEKKFPKRGREKAKAGAKR